MFFCLDPRKNSLHYGVDQGGSLINQTRTAGWLPACVSIGRIMWLTQLDRGLSHTGQEEGAWTKERTVSWAPSWFTRKTDSLKKSSRYLIGVLASLQTPWLSGHWVMWRVSEPHLLSGTPWPHTHTHTLRAGISSWTTHARLAFYNWADCEHFHFPFARHEIKLWTTCSHKKKEQSITFHPLVYRYTHLSTRGHIGG